MRKYTLTSILVLFTIIGISQNDTTFFDKEWEKCNRKEASFYRIVDKSGSDYLVHDMYVNNSPQMIAVCSSIGEPLIKNGKCTFYYENGVISSQGTYKDNKKIGLWMLLENNSQDTTIVEYSLDGKQKDIKSTKINAPPIITTIEQLKPGLVTIPFIEKENKLYIDVYFGSNRIKKTLVFDTDAPFSCDYNTTRDTSFSKILNGKSSQIRTNNGRISTVNHFLANEISFGDVKFKQVEMLEHEDNNKNNGLFGTNVLKTGVWAIDFEKQTITFATDIELMKNLQSFIKIPIRINEKNKILIDFKFDNIEIKDVALDFGFNLTLALSKTNFDLVDFNNKAIVSTGTSTSANDEVKTNFYILKNKKYTISGKEFKTDVFSNDINKSNLVGVEFFKQFNILILDYKNKTIYIKK